MGVSPLDIDENARYIMAFLGDDWPEPAVQDMSRGVLLKHACEDLRTWYFESVATQPGRTAATSTQIVDWFWHETTAGAVLQKLDRVCAASDEEVMQHLGSYLLLPRAVTGTAGDGTDSRANPEFGTHESFGVSR